MYKNQLQELAQRSCFNLPSYSCIREGPDHAPRFKAMVNFNGEVFESPTFCNTLRQAEHAAAEVALSTLSSRGPFQSLGARMLDETGVCKNLLQESAQRAGASLPVYTTIRTGRGHVPVFKCVVEVAGFSFEGEVAKTKKQAEKNAAMAALSAFKLVKEEPYTSEALPPRRIRVAHCRDRSYKECNSSSSSCRSMGKTMAALRSRSFGCSTNEVDLPFEEHLKDEEEWLGGGREITKASASRQWPSSSFSSSLSCRSIGKSMTLRNRSFGCSTNEVNPPFEEHLKDEEEWLGGGRETAKASTSRLWPSSSPSSSLSCRSMGKTMTSLRSRSFGCITNEVTPPFEEHLKDEEEWFAGVRETAKASTSRLCPSSFSSSSLSCRSMGETMTSLRSRSFGCSTNEVTPPFEEHLKDEEWFAGVRETAKASTSRLYPSSSPSSSLSCRSMGKTMTSLRSRSFGCITNEVNPPFEEHLNDEEEWLAGGRETAKVCISRLCPSSLSSSSLSCRSRGETMTSIRSRSFGCSANEVNPPFEEHLKDEEEWLGGGRETAKTSTSRLWPSSSTSTPIWSQMLPSAAHIYSNSLPFQAVASMAPPVRVRQVATVCSAAPPRISDPNSKIMQDWLSKDEEEDTLERLCQLRL